MEHVKDVETRHTVKVTAADILALLNRPPRNVLIPTTATVSFDVPSGADWSGMRVDVAEVLVTWTEKTTSIPPEPKGRS